MVAMAFKNLGLLGEGSFGQVWKCQTPRRRSYHSQHPVVVVKRIKRDSSSNNIDALAEAKLLKSLRHANIVTYLESFYHHGHDKDLCIVMEYCNQGTLTERVHALDKSERSVWSALRQCSSALQYLHDSKNIIHRDLKPDNILCTVDSTTHKLILKIADFGIAKLLHRGRQRGEGYDYTDTCAGTDIYMAPEVVEAGWYAHVRYGKPADIFSLGVVLSFYSNRRHLFSSEQGVLLWPGGQSTLNRNLYSIELRQLVADMMCPDPSYRPTAKEINKEASKPRKYPPPEERVMTMVTPNAEDDLFHLLKKQQEFLQMAHFGGASPW